MSLVALGAVSRPHGVHGQLRVHRYNPDSKALLGRETVVLRRDGEDHERRVLDARLHGKVLLLTLDGLNTVEAADALRGTEICIPRADLPELDSDEFYHGDLIGLAVISDTGVSVGIVSEVIQYPTCDCLLVEAEGKRWEIPIVDPYVTRIDIPARQIVVAHLDDLE